MTAIGFGALLAVNPLWGFIALAGVYVLVIGSSVLAFRRIRKKRRALEDELFRRALLEAAQHRSSPVEMEPAGPDEGGLPE